jgi:uncharacterized protein (TIGR02452 family)
LYTPRRTNDLIQQIKPKNDFNTIVEVTNEITLHAAKRLVSSRKVLSLNFASAINPGGRFLKESPAQEENLARSSGLYSTLITKTEMYEYNRTLKTGYYSDYMICSPYVPVYRNDNGELLDTYYKISFITSPDVNAGLVRSRESIAAQNQIHSEMKKRIEKILAIALHHDYHQLILGAYGCGVFKNHPNHVARYFCEVLTNYKFKYQFNHVLFAVLDNSEIKYTFNIFKNILDNCKQK